MMIILPVIGENYDRIHSVYSDILKSSENTIF